MPLPNLLPCGIIPVSPPAVGDHIPSKVRFLFCCLIVLPPSFWGLPWCFASFSSVGASLVHFVLWLFAQLFVLFLLGSVSCVCVATGSLLAPLVTLSRVLPANPEHPHQHSFPSASDLAAAEILQQPRPL